MTEQEIVQTLIGLTKFKPAFILMVGPPGSGKSTLTQLLALALPIEVMNTDAKVEAKGKALGLEYHQAFGQVKYGGIWSMVRRVWENCNYGKNVLIDQTNMTVASRAKKRALCQTEHWQVCIDLQKLGVTPLELARRVELRYAQGGRYVPEKVILEMCQAYEPPKYDEGFDFIFNYSKS